MSDAQPQPAGPGLDRFLETDVVSQSAMLRDDSVRIEIVESVERLIARDARKAADAGRRIDQATEHGSTRARALRATTTALAYLGRFDEAIATAEEARARAVEAGDSIEAARALVAAMHPRCESGRLEEAIEGGEQARRELIEAEAPDLAIRVDLNLGNIRKMQGDAARALEHLERVIEALTDDDPIRPHALNAIGECHHVLDDLVAAETAFVEAGDLLGEFGGLATAIVLGNRADVAAREGRLQDALDLYVDARARCETLGAEGHAARMLVESGEALLHGGLLDEARQDLEDAVERLEPLGMEFERGRGRLALATVELRRGRRALAIAHADHARSNFLAVANVRLADRAALVAIEACLADDAVDAAEARLEGLPVRDPEADLRAESVARLVMESTIAERRGGIESALARAEEAVETARRLGVAPLSIEALARLAGLQHRHVSPAVALVTAREGVRGIESIRAGLSASRLRTAYLASRTEAYEVLVSALVALGDEASCREAFEVVERARSRGLLERLVGGLDDRAERHAENAEIVALRRRLLGLYAAMDDDGPDEQRRHRVDARQSEIDELEIRLDRLMLEVEARSKPIDAVVPIERLERSLAPGEALIEFFAVEDRLLAFTLLDGRLEVVSLDEGLDRIGTLVTELHFQCRRRLRGTPGPRLESRMQVAAEEALRRLHEAVVRPLPEPIRTAGRWMVVPCGPLAAVPFHALMDGDRAVLDRTVVATAPSAAVAVRLAEVAGRGNGVLVATVADDRAPAIRDEGDEVVAVHPDAVRLDATTATADDVLARLTEVGVAHLACHGRFLPGSPRSSGLRMSDRWLTIRDVHDLPRTPSVVILSGCETGLHPQAGAHELLGLARAFAAGGSRVVVASLWSVHDASATRLMTEMHGAIAGGADDVASAVARSQRRLRQERPHPAFWAPFFCSQACTAGGSAVVEE